jgi:hypothetical protein
MRVRDHVLLSSGAAALLYPCLGGNVALPWAASIFIDVDHYLWFLVQHRRVNPVTAVHLFNDANAPKNPATRPFHHPATLSLLLLLGRRQPTAMLVLCGMTFHAALDTYHRARMANSQTVALNRDHYICQVCARQAADVTAHVWRQPRLLPSYKVGHFITLCPRCHEAAHAQKSRAIARPDCSWESYRDGFADNVEVMFVGGECATPGPPTQVQAKLPPRA